MAAKVVHTLREDKPGLQKQLGCMNGIFQLFDRRNLLGLHRHGLIHNRLTAGEGENEFKNLSEKAKVKNQKKMMIEKNQASFESSRNSFSSSSSSTTSSFDCSKRAQTEWQLSSEPTSPNSHNQRLDWSLPPLDIRYVVKQSMTREIRVTKNKRACSVVKHIDSPRPFVHQKSIQHDRKERNLVKEVKEISRLSCDERESQYSLKSSFKVKEPPRLSLDSKQNSNRNLMNESRSEMESTKRTSSSVVARLMGLDSLTDSIYEVGNVKVKPAFSDQLVSSSPRVHSKIKPALQQHEGCNRYSRKPSVYGEMEKMLNAIEFNTSGKDLRALKQILEAIQMTNTGLKNKEQSLDLQKLDQPCSPMVKGTSSPKRHELQNQATKPAKMATEPKMIKKHNDANHTDKKKVNYQTLKKMKATGTGRTPSPRLQNSKNGVNKHCFNGPSSDSIRFKKQSHLKAKHPKTKPINPMQNNEKLFRYRNDGDTVSFKSKSKSNLVSQRKLEVTRNDQPKENHIVSENDFAVRLMEDKPMVELSKLSVEQPSPVSVLDAFYIEDPPSPIKNRPKFFNDNENLLNDQIEWNRAGIHSLVNDIDADQQYEFNHIKLENRTPLIRQTELLNSIDERTNGDHEYIREILLASGFLKDLCSAIWIVQLQPTCSLIKPELFQLLQNPSVEDDKNTRSTSERIKRKLIFDFVSEILFHKLVNWNAKLSGRFMNEEKLLKELCLEIDTLQNCSRTFIYDEEEDDDVTKLVSADVNRKSEDWDKCCYEVPGVVLDIERLIFKDLIDEVVNAEAARPAGSTEETL